MGCDVSDQDERTDRMRDRATRDALTGLLNRSEFEREFERERAAMRADARHALIFIDLEGVRGINQDHGWPAGDEVLRRMAGVIRASVGVCGTAGRVAGCHFMVLMKDRPLQRGVEFAEQLARTIEHSSVVERGTKLGVSVWIGVVEVGHGSPGLAECWGAASRAAQLARVEAGSSRERVRSGVRIAEVPQARHHAVEASARACAEQDVAGESPDPVQQMLYQASHDALTGLLNRREFEWRVRESIDATRAGGQRAVLCHLDLDRFKTVNDECGHMTGDALLRELADAIRRTVPEAGSVARTGGDEFGILLSDCSLETATQIAEEVVRAVADHRFVWQERSFELTVSVGLVEISSESGSLVDVLCTAETICDLAKQQGGGRVCDHSAIEEAAVRQRAEMRLLKRLQSALEENGFELRARPIASVDGDLASSPGLEVVLILKDENGAPIAPSEFMSTAELFGLMRHVDRWVVQTAFAALSRGAVQLPVGRTLTIRLSGQSLCDATLLCFVVDCFDRTGVTPDRICFEVAEESIASNIEHARRFMGVLLTMGCRFALYIDRQGVIPPVDIKCLRCHYIRFDGDWLRDVASDKVNRAELDATVELARSLGVQVIVGPGED